MVQTRRQYRAWMDEQQQIRGRRRFIHRKRYRPTDFSKRHRLPDQQPKTKVVRTYVRRT